MFGRWIWQIFACVAGPRSQKLVLVSDMHKRSATAGTVYTEIFLCLPFDFILSFNRVDQCIIDAKVNHFRLKRTWILSKSGMILRNSMYHALSNKLLEWKIFLFLMEIFHLKSSSVFSESGHFV
jgi:hypothetical protein